MALTTDQKRIVDSPSKNLLISAGAGSGKTFTLTKRVISLIKDKGYSLKEMVILTFTDLAANEMKGRIMSALKEEHDPRLDDELKHIDEADICTFDAFCNKFVKKYACYSILPSTFVIGDKSVFDMMESRYMDEVLSEYYASPSDSFNRLIEAVKSNTGDSLKRFLLNVFDNILSKNIDVNEYLDTYISKYFNEAYINECMNEYFALIRKKLSFLSTYNIDLPEDADDKYYMDASDLKNSVADLLLISDNNLLIDKLLSFTIKNQPSIKKTEAEKYASYKKSRGEFKSLLNSTISMLETSVGTTSLPGEEKETKTVSVSSLINEYKNLKPVYETMLSIFKNVYSILEAFKKDRNIYSFNDIQKETIRIFKTHPSIQDYYKSHIKEILIDEYQDTNDIGNEIVSYMSNNNVLVVGDIKQSIYRFRGANPSIFNNLMEEYEKIGNGEVIRLKENFRSRKEEVLDIVNNIFTNVKDYPDCSMPYFKDTMAYGNTEYDHFNDEKNAFSVIEVADEEDEFDLVAKDIKSRMVMGQMVYDTKEKASRKATPKDFMVLSFKNGDAMKSSQALKKYNVPSKLYTAKEFFSSKEIVFLKNALIVLHYYDYDVVNDKGFNQYFVTVLKNFIVNKSGDFILKYMLLSGKSSNKDAIKEMCPEIDDIFNHLVTTLHHYSATEALKEIILKFNVYERLMHSYSLEEKEIRVASMVSTIENLSKMRMDLEDCVRYFDFLKTSEEELEVKQNDLDTLDYVSCMSIHKSKGLEKPFVYITGLRSKSKESAISYSKDYGINFKNDATFISFLIRNDDNLETNREKLRVLYVALTRAKESNTLLLDPGLEEYTGDFSAAKLLENLLCINNNYNKYIRNVYSSDEEINNSPDPSLFISKYSYEEINPPQKKEIIKTHASHELYQEDGETLKALEYGTYVHSLFERTNFLSDKFADNVDRLDCNDKEKVYLYHFKDHPIFDGVSLREFHELKYYLESENGIIDYMLEKPDKFIIVDFKLKDIDDPLYVVQLGTYKRYIESRTDKPVYTYLYSIIKNELKEV